MWLYRPKYDFCFEGNRVTTTEWTNFQLHYNVYAYMLSTPNS